MRHFKISASILSANFAILGEEVKRVIAAGADFIHFDVMDNHYVPNLTIGPLVCQSLRNYGVTAPIDVHLMTEPVDNLITSFAEAGANYITIHPEATKHLDRSLQLIKDHGCKAGVALNPATPISSVEYVLEKIDLLLLMSVNPGFGGQQFLKNVLPKINRASQVIHDLHHPVLLQVDGGIKIDNIAKIANEGADTFVVGSQIFASENYDEVIGRLRAELNKVTH